MAHASLETFYGGAVRSMSQNWHDFFFGSFDPWGTVSVDKLPGAFWLQALSLRVFGFHLWAYVLPSAIEGTLTVLVLYRVVRRVGGAGAGLTAAVALAATPVTILLNRGNISDSLLVLLLVLAADAATSAYLSGRPGALVLAGVWVGLAFQAKMLQAWLVLPALYLAYLLAAPAVSLVRRFGHVALSLLVAVVVSLSWMCVVTLVPAHDRPYVDGSCDNSVFSQVFLYNGADRLTGNTLDQPGCTKPPVSVTSTSTGGAETVSLGTGPGRFLNGLLGRDAAWLFLPALVALFALVLARRNESRTDPWRAAALLWGVWLILTWCFFASSQFLNAYYLAALAPPMAALCGLGLALAWRRREESAVVPVILMATVAAGVAYAVYLVPDGAGVRPWIVATSALATVATLVVLARSLRPGRRDWERRYGLALGAGALLLGAVWASATSVAAETGPVRLALPAGGGDGRGADGLAAQRGHLARHCRLRPDQPAHAGRRHLGDLGPGEHLRPGHRARVPPRRRLQRAGAEHAARRLRRRRARRAHLTCGGVRAPAHPQPRHGLDGGPLRGGAHAGRDVPRQREPLPTLCVHTARRRRPKLTDSETAS